MRWLVQRDVVLYPEHGWDDWGANNDVKKAGDAIIAAYPQIDVGIAEPSDPNFAKTLDQNRAVEGIASAGSVVASPAGAGTAWNDDSGHGTNVADVIAAEANGQGIIGIAPPC